MVWVNSALYIGMNPCFYLLPKPLVLSQLFLQILTLLFGLPRGILNDDLNFSRAILRLLPSCYLPKSVNN